MPSKAAKQRRHRVRKKESHSLKSLDASTSRGVPLPSKYKLSAFSDCTFVRGNTLERFWERPDTVVPEGKYFLVRTLPESQIRQQCDACVGQHEPTNVTCSQTLDRESPYVDDTILYNFYSKAGPHYKYHVLAEHVLQGSRVCSVVVQLSALSD
jgi:hypothetical protein